MTMLDSGHVAPLTERLFSLAGKTAIVTGGSRGIGAMITRGLVECGARTYITARKADDCQAAAEEFSRYGTCVAVPCDLSKLANIGEFVEVLGQREDKIDILFNNAGAAWGAPFDEYSEAGWDKVFDINLKSVFFLTQALHGMLSSAGTADDPARVVNIASINGITHPHANNYAYSASKAAVIQLTRHLAGDLAADNINVNAIAPGYFPSRMTAHIAESDEAMIGAIPRGRAGSADDIAGAAIFLASRAGAWITGSTLVVDGGMVANA